MLCSSTSATVFAVICIVLPRQVHAASMLVGFQQRHSSATELQQNINDASLFEGDIIIGDIAKTAGDDDVGGADDSGQWAYAAVRSQAQRWLDATIPYVFDSSVSTPYRTILRNIMNEFERHTCVKFVPYVKNPGTEEQRAPFVTFYLTAFRQCAATLGLRYLEKNKVILNKECFAQNGTIMHELMHILGFYHEQSRADRDQYVVINTANIKPGAENQFKSYSAVEVDHLGYEYDYGSLMHYALNAFSADGESNTIEPIQTVPPNVSIGQRANFSATDLNKIRTLFECPLTCNANTEFRCSDNSTCIPLAKKCNGHSECKDGSDERKEQCFLNCTKTQFNCGTKCIPRSWVCDGAQDCEEGYDEAPANCTASCPTDGSSFYCQKDRLCIPIYRRCNNQFDCPSREDETGCPSPHSKEAQQKLDDGRFVRIDPCTNFTYYQQNHAYCYFNYRLRRYLLFSTLLDTLLSGQNSGGDLWFSPIQADTVNIACGLPVTTILNSRRVKIDVNSIVEKQLCHNLIITNAVINTRPSTVHDNALHNKLSLPSTVETFIRTTRAKIVSHSQRAQANATAKVQRNMEIYLGIGGRGAVKTLNDIAGRGPQAVEAFANSTSAYARNLEVDGVVLDWPNPEIDAVSTIFKQLENSFRHDPTKNSKTIDLLLGAVITDALVQYNSFPQVKALVDALDFVMLTSATHGAPSEFSVLQPLNQLLIDTVVDGLPVQRSDAPAKFSQHTKMSAEVSNLAEKFFLTLQLGGKHYVTDPLQAQPNRDHMKTLQHTTASGQKPPTTAKFGFRAYGPALSNTVSSQAGRLSADEVCAKLQASSQKYERFLLTYEKVGTNGANGTLQVPVARLKTGKDFIAYETECSMMALLKTFRENQRVPRSQFDGRKLQYAGIYVPDIGLDDTRGLCETQKPSSDTKAGNDSSVRRQIKKSSTRFLEIINEAESSNLPQELEQKCRILV